MRRGTAGLLLLLMLALAAGCGSDNSKQDAAAAARARARARLHARAMATGQRVFAKHCASCHTLAGRVAHPTFIESPIPNLDEVKPRAEYVLERAESGGIDMPSFGSEMSEAQMKAVATYVAEVAGGRVTDSGRADASAVAMGEQVFHANCARCHGIGGDEATNKPPAVYPGTDFNKVKPSRALVLERVTRGITSGEEMPAFGRRLTSAQIQAVAAYVTATAGE